jgi:hypothetical protein
LQLLQERALEAIVVGKDFLSRTLAAQQLRERMDKWDCMKLKSFCTTKDMVSKLTRSSTEWEKIFSHYTSDKGLITIIYGKVKKLYSKINESTKKWATEKTGLFQRKSPNGRKTHEKMLTFPGHKGNANQIHTKIPPHSC